jgi:hypothetical protein
MKTLAGPEYAHLALEPDEALRNIFLALCSYTGTISRDDFVNFVIDSGAMDRDQITPEDLELALECVTSAELKHDDFNSAHLSNDIHQALDFKKFKLAMVRFVASNSATVLTT